MDKTTNKKGESPSSIKSDGVGKVRVRLGRSMHGRLKNHQACARGLGLRKMHQTVEVLDTPQNRGMIKKIAYMLELENAQNG